MGGGGTMGGGVGVDSNGTSDLSERMPLDLSG